MNKKDRLPIIVPKAVPLSFLEVAFTIIAVPATYKKEAPNASTALENRMK